MSDGLGRLAVSVFLSSSWSTNLPCWQSQAHIHEAKAQRAFLSSIHDSSLAGMKTGGVAVIVRCKLHRSVLHGQPVLNCSLPLHPLLLSPLNSIKQ